MVMEKPKLKRCVLKEEMVVLTGGYRLALVLNQMIYWSERVRDFNNFIAEEKVWRKDLSIEVNFGWIFKTAEELAEETLMFCDPKTMRDYLRRIVESGLLEERANPYHRWDHTSNIK